MDPLAQQSFFWKLKYLTIYAHTCRRCLAVAFFAVAKRGKQALCPSRMTGHTNCHKAVNWDLKGEESGRPSVPEPLGSAPRRIRLRKKHTSEQRSRHATIRVQEGNILYIKSLEIHVRIKYDSFGWLLGKNSCGRGPGAGVWGAASTPYTVFPFRTTST